jgi:hypothetical protein
VPHIRADARACILVCIDDIEWCAANLPARYPFIPRAQWVFQAPSCSGADTLVLMARCGLGGIMANSSLSWCGAVLGRSLGANGHARRYVAPNYFFRCPWPHTPRVSSAARFLPKWCAVLDVGHVPVTYENVLLLATLVLVVVALGVAAHRGLRSLYLSGHSQRAMLR